MKALLPFAVGVAAVLQGVLNRRVMSEWGLSAAVLLNSLVFLVVSLGLLALARSRPELFPDSFAPSASWSTLAWWFILPGLFGMVIVLGIPWAIDSLGAARVFVGIVAAQMVASLVWDHFMEGVELSLERVGGTVLAVVGAWLVGRGGS